MQPEELHTLQVYADDDKTIHCLKCQRVLKARDIAFLTRTWPTDGFHAWCPVCAAWLIQQAAAQLDLEDDTAIAATF